MLSCRTVAVVVVLLFVSFDTASAQSPHVFSGGPAAIANMSDYYQTTQAKPHKAIETFQNPVMTAPKAPVSNRANAAMAVDLPDEVFAQSSSGQANNSIVWNENIQKPVLPTIKKTIAAPPALHEPTVSKNEIKTPLTERNTSILGGVASSPVAPPALNSAQARPVPQPAAASVAVSNENIIPHTVAPAQVTTPVVPENASLAPTPEREKLANINGLDNLQYAPLPAKPKSSACTGDHGDELQSSLLIKIALLEKEKENLRKRLMAFDAGQVTPVYQCAAQERQVEMLQSKVTFLLEENDSLRRKNQELMSIPQLPNVDLGELPDEKGAVASRLLEKMAPKQKVNEGGNG